MNNTCSFYFLFHIFKGLLTLICQIQPLDLLFFVVLFSFTSVDIIFHKVLGLHSTLSEERIFVTNFPFLTDSLPPPLQTPPPPHPRPFHPLNGQHLLSVTTVFC